MTEIEPRLPARALIVGCGDIGLRVATALRAMGREVTGIVRSGQNAAALSALGVDVRVADLDLAAPSDDAPLVLWLAPPPSTGVTDPRLRRWLIVQGEREQRVIYVSTSGVYGDCGGRWIDETEPLDPQTDRARRRVDAEIALAGRAVILRVPGIYGPGRLPVERLRQGLPVIRDAESGFSNRIHADDLGLAVLHASAFGVPGRAYHVADGQPTTMTDYFRRCAQHLGLPPPPQVSLDEARRTLSSELLSFAMESRRLRIDRLRDELRFAPRYPDLASGLPACG
jgi:nucleoside-diphosphate-sugar epimerase